MMARWKGVIALLAVLAVPSALHAQSEVSPRPFAWDVVRAVLIDPTTYAPAAISYEAMMQDWRTSQALFARGWAEVNPRFTTSGRPNDAPVAYGAGKRIIVGSALDVLQWSVAHNVGIGVVERLLIARHPEQKKLIRAISWIERIGYASLLTYRKSGEHFRQASANRRLAREYYPRR